MRRGAATGVAVRTPLIPFVGAPGNLLIKPESLQQTSAFKLCSAYNAISALLETEGPTAAKANGVVAPSSGNPGSPSRTRPRCSRSRPRSSCPATAPAVKTDAIVRTGA